ncbi:hypothetical protein BDV37DRAFT_241534 [Aspergillus pseudonomiae]|uniref:Uncharacterized protein n=1 Tax=Aspergillus pseudonomiae TaxID=1506151 RepID=A0A5N7DMP3_9EURO|nr:uncharacterized protein BDV37DRAFT_241534 [Aspergillus pseudonomiae]KAE8407329.1 hypothetical protein BDV37DRAFT_241534 [Aspergillus pseudonomiae]
MQGSNFANFIHTVQYPVNLRITTTLNLVWYIGISTPLSNFFSFLFRILVHTE